jgi:hypothetical protein
MSTIPAANSQFATGINDAGGNFATGGKQWEQYQAAETLK